LLIVTRDYMTTGLYYVKFLSFACAGDSNNKVHSRHSLHTIPLTCDENDPIQCEVQSFTLYKLDWHITPQKAFKQILVLIFHEQTRLLTKQQEATEFLFGNKTTR
jgi:hypothetical protein